MIHKELLIPDRVRRPPREGWSWIDRRFLREHAARLSHCCARLDWGPVSR
jgi:hypothetical protein